MASNFHVQKPYVLATLPSPLSRLGSPGKFTVGDVFGHRSGSRKRKRLEVAVGIDGDAVNLYDVASSRLITSYPIPPQQFFSCPPCSVRWRSSSSKNVIRATFVCSEEAQSSERRITLFKDVVKPSGDTASTSLFRHLRTTVPVHYLTTISAAKRDLSHNSEDLVGLDLLAVTEDGSIQCLDGETLSEKWHVPPSTFLQHLRPTETTDCQVVHVQSTTAMEVVAGILRDSPEPFDVFRQKLTMDGFNPDILVLITSGSSSLGAALQYMHFLGINTADSAHRHGVQHVLHISTFAIPNTSRLSSTLPEYQVDIDSGSLIALRGAELSTFTVHEGVLKLLHSRIIEGISSVLRLSHFSLLASLQSKLVVYNPTYHSELACAEFDPDDGEPARCQLVIYFKKLKIAVAIQGTALVAVQIEPPRSRKRKRRAEGMLIDSIGRGMDLEGAGGDWSHAMDKATDQSQTEWKQDVITAQEFIQKGDMADFEMFMAKKYRMKFVKEERLTNGVYHEDGDSPKNNKSGPSPTAMPSWKWPSGSKFPRADRRWIFYGITQTFTWESGHNQAFKGSLRLQDYDQMPVNLINYLIAAGHITVSNVKSAFRRILADVEGVHAVLGEQLPQALANADPTLVLLRNYLESTRLGPVELLASIRIIMRSLDLVSDPDKVARKLLLPAPDTHGEHPVDGDGDGDAALGMDLDLLEQDLEVTESHLLHDDDNVRALALETALSKLGTCSASDTVSTLQRLFNPEEMLSLIHVLRVELVKGGWTTRYLDTSHFDDVDGDVRSDEISYGELGHGEHENTSAQVGTDDSIRVIADLLCRCLDAVGAGGWVLNDAVALPGGPAAGILEDGPDGLAYDSADFVAALRLEVSAALEGIQEVQYLRGILAEMVKYGRGIKAQGAVAEVRELPLGLLGSAKSKVSAEKIISGGEVVERSRRERAHLLSQNVGPYTLERIEV